MPMKISTVNAVITDPIKAREYVRHFVRTFKESEGKDITFVKTNAGEIQLEGMTDDEAVFVANQFQQITAEAAKMRGQAMKEGK